MTLVPINKHVIWPGYSDGAEGSYATGQSAAQVIDAAGEYFAVVLQAAEDMSIRTVDVCFHITTTSVMDIRIETLDSSGLPSGTLWATGTNKNTSTLNGGVAVETVTLDATATITRGEKFAVVVKYVSGTSASPAWLISGRGPSAWRGSTFPYIVNNTGTPTKAAFAAGSLCMALGDATPTFYQVSGLIPWSAGAASHSIANNTTNRAAALRFQVPFKCRVIGMRFDDSSAATTDDVTCVIYDDSNAEVSSTATAINRDETFIGSGIVTCFFDSPATLDANTTYRAAVVADTTNTTNFPYLTLTNVNRAGALLGGGQCYLSLRDSAGTWADTTTQVPRIDLIIDQIDDGTGDGGGGGASFYAFVG